MSPPDLSVLGAFGIADTVPTPLAGGQGTTWLAGGVVLKPISGLEEAEWVASVLHELPESGYRVSRPIRSNAGAWTTSGWSAWSWVSGSHDLTRGWKDVLAAGRSFHLALGDLTRPAFLDQRNDPWSLGDRAAWGTPTPTVTHQEFRPIVEVLAALRTPCEQRGQIVHGDLAGNVLFDDPRPPAIIDFVPYWRPAAFADAIVVADAILWHGAGPGLVDCLGGEARSMLARAAIYRLVTSDLAAARHEHDRSDYLAQEVNAQRRLLSVVETM